MTEKQATSFAALRGVYARLATIADGLASHGPERTGAAEAAAEINDALDGMHEAILLAFRPEACPWDTRKRVEAAGERERAKDHKSTHALQRDGIVYHI